MALAFDFRRSAQYFFTATEGVLSGRLASWRTLGAWIEAHPWQMLFGIGYKTLPYTRYVGAPVVADNMYLSLLVETGVAGLAALIWLNVAILRTAAKASRSGDSQRAFCGMWMLCFWAGEVVQMAASNTVLQTIVEEDKRGRVMSFYTMAFMGTAPFGHDPAGRFNVEAPDRGRLLYIEDSPRRVRGYLGDELVVDSRRVKLLHEHAHLPVWYFPLDDLRQEMLEVKNSRLWST